jgi:nucleotide-binding universal stress UspA family protein
VTDLPGNQETDVFQTIIIGIEGRPQDAEVLALAMQLGEPGAEIIAAKIAVVDESLFQSVAASSQDALLADSESTVDAFTESRVTTEGVVMSAPSVGQGLAELAMGARADLIVVASSRRGLAGRVFAGDAVRDVLRHAPCPVAVATVGHAADGALARIVVGYDASVESAAALEAAMQIARRDGASVSVVEVVEPTIAVASMSGAYTGTSIDDGFQSAKAHLQRVLEEHGLHGVVAVGRAAHELAEASRGADLLAIGLHEYGLLDRLLIGSTSHALLREQCAPMLITPPVQATKAPVADGLDSVPVARASPAA